LGIFVFLGGIRLIKEKKILCNIILMSSGIAYPPPTYIPPLPVFNPLFFPQSFGTTTSSGGGSQSNIFPSGLTSGDTISLNGGTGGQGGTGIERTITGISYLDFVDSADTNPTNITGYITLNGNTLEIGSNSASSGINVNLLGSVVSANGVAIANGGNVSNNINNTFQSPATTQTFDTQSVVMNNSALSFSNGGVINLNGGGSSQIIFPSILPTTSTGLLGGLGIIWNQQGGGGQGETDLICYGQQAGGSNISGLNIYNCNNTTAPVLVASFNANQTNFYSNIASNNTFTGDNYFNTGFINLTNITGSFPSTPVGYSQYVSYGGNPWFSPTNGGGVQIATATTLLNYAPINSPTFTGTPSAPTPTAGDSSTHLATTSFVATSFAPKNSPTFTGIPIAPTATFPNSSTQLATTAFVSGNFAPLASPTFTGIPTAPTALSTDNSTQIATTAFVKNVISSSSIQVVSINTGNGGSRFDINEGTGTYWISAPDNNFPISSYPTPPFGYSFNYSLYTNITAPTQSVPIGGTLDIQGLYTTTIGTGAVQPFSQNGINYWGYVLSAQIVTQGGLTDIYYAYNNPVAGNNFWYFFTSSTDSSLLNTSLTMNIYVV